MSIKQQIIIYPPYNKYNKISVKLHYKNLEKKLIKKIIKQMIK